MADLNEIDIIPLVEIYKAQENAPIEILKTPLVRLNMEFPDKEIYLKLENIQPTGSFKVRGAYNDMLNSDQKKLKDVGAYAASSGNFAQGLAWAANQFDVKCEITVPDTAAKVKIKSIQDRGAVVDLVPRSEWWKCMMTRNFNDKKGVFFHTSNYHSMAANGVIGLEILEELPDVSTIIVPFGSGTNGAGIASAVKQLKTDVSVYACEVDTAAPFRDSLEAGCPSYVKNPKTSFVGGMNGLSMFPWMWNIATKTLDGTIVLNVREICEAIKLLFLKNGIVAEGAAGATLAAVLKEESLKGKIVCVITGENIDKETIETIMRDDIPIV